MPMITSRELFGGAITMDLPSSLIDASDLRQVPDNQEVFLSPDSDESFVLEILQRVEANDGEDAAKFHFESLAHDNSATSCNVIEVTLPRVPQSPSPPATHAIPYPTILFGNQEVRKFNRTTPDQVHILMALYRVEGKEVDLVLTENIPSTIGEGQRSDDESWNTARRGFYAIAESLKIVDFGLFA